MVSLVFDFERETFLGHTSESLERDQRSEARGTEVGPFQRRSCHQSDPDFGVTTHSRFSLAKVAKVAKVKVKSLSSSY